MDKLQFTPNVPAQIALKFADGKLVEGRYGDQVMFSLTNGQVMYLDTDVAAKINLLDLRKAEPFMICKRWTGKKGDSPQWDIWREEGLPAHIAAAVQATGIPASEVELERRDRAQAGAGVSAPAPVTAATQPPQVNNGNGNKPASGNGTNGTNGHGANGVYGVPPAPANNPLSNGGNNGGNGAPKPYVASGAPLPPSIKVGYDVALRRILRVTIAELKTAGEQWSDAARQDLVSTLMIQAARDGVITWTPLSREEGN